MSDSRLTEIMNNEADIMSRPTEIMKGTNESGGRETEIMDHAGTNDISSSQVIIGSTIGNGFLLDGIIAENTGEAMIFHCTRDSREYAAKVYHRHKRPKTEIVESIKAINSPYVIKILEDGEVQDRYFEILPYYKKGDLQSTPPGSDFVKNVFIRCMNEGLHAIHEKGIIHRDIKPNNIYYSDDGQSVVIGDFGISSRLDDGISVRLTSQSRTAGYAAPEVYNGMVSKESDYYSLGITILHLVLGRDYFEGMNDLQAYLITCVKKIEIPSGIDERLARLIKGLIIKDRTDRWGYEEVCRWLKNEYVELRETYAVKPGVEPYQFADGNEYNELQSLLLAFAQNWDEGKKHLFRRELFLDYAAKACSKAQLSIVMDCMEESDQDLGLFKLICLLDKNTPLCWKGRIFGDITSFVDEVLKEYPNMSPYFIEVLKLGIVSFYMEARSYEKAVIQKVRDIESEQDIEMAFFKLIYLLDPFRPLYWRGEIHTDIDGLSRAIGMSEPKKSREHFYSLVVSGGMEYYMRAIGLDKLADRIEDIRKEESYGQDAERMLFRIIYVLNPEAPFYWNSIEYKDTLELYKYIEYSVNNALYKLGSDSIKEVRLVQSGLLSYYLRLKGHEELAADIETLRKDSKNGIECAYRLMFLLNPEPPYIVEGKAVDVNSIAKGILNIKYHDEEDFIEKASWYVKLLLTLGYYYYGIGKKDTAGKLLALESYNHEIAAKALKGRLSVKEYSSVKSVLFRMLYILDASAPLWWKGKIYRGMNDIIDSAMVELEKQSYGDVCDMLKAGAVSYFLEVKGMDAEAEKVRAIENKASDSYAALTKLVCLYRPDAPLIIGGHGVKGILELKELISGSLNKCMEESGKIARGYVAGADERRTGVQLYLNEDFAAVMKDTMTLIGEGILQDKFNAVLDSTDENSEKFLRSIRDITDLSGKDAEAAFWRLYFLLDGNGVFYYRKSRITSIESLIEKALDIGLAGRLDGIAETMLKDKYFCEWMRHMGFGEGLDQILKA